MNAPATSSSPHPRRRRRLDAAILAALLAAISPMAVVGAEPSASPDAAAGSPAPTLTPAAAFCESADDLRFIVGYLRDTDAGEDGWLPIFVGATAAISEARQLAGAADETYRPLVEDMVGSLEGVRTTAEELGELGTAGAKIAAIGQAITDIGMAMDALSVQLREPCPGAATAASGAPAASAARPASKVPAG